MRRSGLSTDEIAEFLRSKGAIEALLAIGTDGGRWSDIEEQVDISTATLTERLGDARE
jgi:DNA-binding HxlR family transcriptional regulator